MVTHVSKLWANVGQLYHSALFVLVFQIVSLNIYMHVAKMAAAQLVLL